MPRRGDPLTNKILEEIRTTLTLFFRKFTIKVVDLDLATPAVIYNTQLSCATIPWKFEEVCPKTFDPLVNFKNRILKTFTGSILSRAPLAPERCCEWNPILAHASILSPETAAWHQVTFEKIQHAVMGPPVYLEFEKSPKIQAICSQLKTKMYEFSGVRLEEPKSKRFPIQQYPSRSRQMPSRYYLFANLKQATPLYRYSTEIRNKFRQALATKAKTQPSNIMVVAVYDRMNIGLYQTIKQDPKGNLLCFPKRELVGKTDIPVATKLNLLNQPLTYLIFGTRLDTKESVQIVIPQAEVEGMA